LIGVILLAIAIICLAGYLILDKEGAVDWMMEDAAVTGFDRNNRYAG
jgi:hypothetical protein